LAFLLSELIDCC